MNYFLEVSKCVEEFCDTKPVPDRRDEYLEVAGRIKELHEEAICLENDESVTDDSRIIEIYNELKEILG